MSFGYKILVGIWTLNQKWVFILTKKKLLWKKKDQLKFTAKRCIKKTKIWAKFTNGKLSKAYLEAKHKS